MTHGVTCPSCAAQIEIGASVLFVTCPVCRTRFAPSDAIDGPILEIGEIPEDLAIDEEGAEPGFEAMPLEGDGEAAEEADDAETGAESAAVPVADSGAESASATETASEADPESVGAVAPAAAAPPAPASRSDAVAVPVTVAPSAEPPWATSSTWNSPAAPARTPRTPRKSHPRARIDDRPWISVRARIVLALGLLIALGGGATGWVLWTRAHRLRSAPDDPTTIAPMPDGTAAVVATAGTAIAGSDGSAAFAGTAGTATIGTGADASMGEGAAAILSTAGEPVLELPPTSTPRPTPKPKLPKKATPRGTPRRR